MSTFAQFWFNLLPTIYQELNKIKDHEQRQAIIRNLKSINAQLERFL